MRAAVPFALCAVTGCDVVYGLGGPIDADAAQVDAPDIDSSMPCIMYNHTVTAVADTMLMRDSAGNCNPSIRLGRYTNINLGQGASADTRSRILLRFSLSSDMIMALQPSGGFMEASLTLPLKPVACPGPCPSTPLDFSIHAAHNDWNEGEESGNIGAAWCARKQLVPGVQELWTVEGADGTDDRSMMSLGDVSVDETQASGDELVVTATPSPPVIENARTWLVGSELSLLMVPRGTATGTLYVKAREASGGGVQLTIKSCR